MGETMEVGRVVAWLKKPGEAFERGETIAEIETDKVTVEMPALDAGRLIEILAPEGAEVAVGEPLGRYDLKKGDAADEAAPRSVALVDMVMPRMGETMEEGRVSAWLKQPGEKFRRGEVVTEIETDKVTVEMPALTDGELVEILVQPGESASVGAPIARYSPVAGVAAPMQLPPAYAAEVSAPPPVRTIVRAQTGDRLRATPAARRLARQAGLNITMATGSGRRGRVERADIERALEGSPAVVTTLSSVPEPRYVDLPQGRMAYREWGSESARRTVLFFHGFSADAGTWAPVASALARSGTRVIAPDLPSHGSTGFDATGFDAVCAAAMSFVEAVGPASSDVVAHSMGAAVAARLTAARQLRVGALTLIAPAGLGPEIDADFIHGVAGVTTDGALAHLLRRLARRPPQLSRAQLGGMVRDFAKGRLKELAADLAAHGRQGVDIVPDLAAIPDPLRIIWGLEDRIIPWTQVAAAPSRAAIHLISDAGHMPQWDKPEELAALL